jgi:hypothetical protein
MKHTVQTTLTFYVENAINEWDAAASVEAALDRIDGVTLDDGTVVRIDQDYDLTPKGD